MEYFDFAAGVIEGRQGGHRIAVSSHYGRDGRVAICNISCCERA